VTHGLAGNSKAWIDSTIYRGLQAFFSVLATPFDVIPSGRKDPPREKTGNIDQKLGP